MIDFDDLVVSVGQDVFAKDVLYTPDKSLPGASPFFARGVYSARPIFVEIEGGSVQTLEHKLSVRLSEFAAMPAQKDALMLDGRDWIVSNVELDGQGAASLTLKARGS